MSAVPDLPTPAQREEAQERFIRSVYDAWDDLSTEIMERTLDYLAAGDPLRDEVRDVLWRLLGVTLEETRPPGASSPYTVCGLTAEGFVQQRGGAS
jgi:hypothetical protein